MVTVLIVDDDKFLHKVLERILLIGGHQVVDHAFDGAEALKKFIQLSPKPDIILMDHRMPVMNGTTTTRKLLAMDKSARIVFISADDSVYDEAIDAGAKGFLTKPIRSTNLFEALKKYME
ncbi:MAG: response regulator [Candidatus Thorarchaeota archaeon]